MYPCKLDLFVIYSLSYDFQSTATAFRTIE